MTGMKRKLYRGDAVIVCLILLFCALGALFPLFAPRTDTPAVTVTLDGKLYGTYALDSDTTLYIGQTGVRLAIANGKAYIAESDCPDKICVHSGALYVGDSGKSLVCLPNRVAVTLSSAKPGMESEVDGIAG